MVLCLLDIRGYNMIDKIKLDISSKLNKKVNIKINNIRNKAEILEGVIK